jgi:hypothetical protein
MPCLAFATRLNHSQTEDSMALLWSYINHWRSRLARVAVVGVGAIGGALAAQLNTTGTHEITLCTRRPLEESIVKTPEGTVRVKTRNLTNPTEVEAVDWVVVATKTYDQGERHSGCVSSLQRACRWRWRKTRWSIGNDLPRGCSRNSLFPAWCKSLCNGRSMERCGSAGACVSSWTISRGDGSLQTCSREANRRLH